VNATATTVNLGGGASAVNIGAAGSATTFAGNITGSNALFSGDVVINGGDLTSTAATFNLFSGSVGNTLNVGATTGFIQIGNATGASTVRLAYGNTASPAIKTVEIGVNGQSGSTTNITLGAVSGSGRTTFNNDVALATGNIIGAPGSGANVMTLISSGNIIAKLDTNNDGAGHKFIVRDWRDIEQFSVGEDGNAEISGSLAISGSTSLGTTVERLTTSTGGTGVVSFDTTFNSIFYVNGPTGDITANFTNVPTANNNRVLTPTIILSQSATPRTITAVQVNGTGSSILWANGTTPTVAASKQEVFGFSLIRSGSIWTVLGQMSTYG
jgi:hypothetical protein